MIGARPLADVAGILESHANAGEGQLVAEALTAVESAFVLLDSFMTQEIEKG